MNSFYKESFPEEDTLSLEYSDLNEIKDLSTLTCKGLILDNNRIHQVSAEHLPHSLTHLSVSFNGISMSGLPFQPLRNLKTLLITHNEFYNLSRVVGELFPQLETLNIQENYIEDVQFLSSLQTLKHLNVKKNDIHILHALPDGLETLQASQCRLRMIQSKLPSTLQRIYLSSNKLRFGGLPLSWGSALRYLDLSRNKIEKFPRKLPDLLEHLNLSHNLLTEIPYALPSSLQTLHLGHNCITSVPTHMNGYVVRLVFLSNNHITHETTSHVRWAKVLYDDGNWNQSQHHIAQKTLRRFFQSILLEKRLRIYWRSRILKNELLEVSMQPVRALQLDQLNPGWFSNHIDHLKD